MHSWRLNQHVFFNLPRRAKKVFVKTCSVVCSQLVHATVYIAFTCNPVRLNAFLFYIFFFYGTAMREDSLLTSKSRQN